MPTETERETQRETDRQTDRQLGRQKETDIKTGRRGGGKEKHEAQIGDCHDHQLSTIMLTAENSKYSRS